MISAEYIWIDGQTPTRKLRSKTKVLPDAYWGIDNGGDFNPFTHTPNPHRSPLHYKLPNWSFDGSSTDQAKGEASDCILKPVKVIFDPIRAYPVGADRGRNLLVMCEVLNPKHEPHISNTRCWTNAAQKEFAEHECLFGIEQEYTFYHGSTHAGDVGIPLGWPERGPASPQGKYYCGVGADEVKGRQIVEKHLAACCTAGIPISGINAEVMPGQWEYQIGPVSALDVSDYLWLSRWILYRIAEDFNVTVKLDPKPLAGDWNGAGAHTNFSTKQMRKKDGHELCLQACESLKTDFDKNGFPEYYGAGFKERLTGEHETCPWSEFRYGASDRTASIRIPAEVKNGCGYIEDRRPCANIDPYEVTAYLMETICGAI